MLYVSDSYSDSKWLTARCGDQTGLIPRSYGFSEQSRQIWFDCFVLGESRGPRKHCHANANMLIAIPNMCISAQNKLGDTALHAAAWNVRILLNSVASISVRNNEL
ncbi:unnamed protein product [Toxocara canis]|uniref:Uncharacterized protein n=1 Tax=Toxocara canis TaxID=6265 RepID=A0A3P7GTW6_TOXCA|nr:unnamed protein product [Toxocara canis]